MNVIVEAIKRQEEKARNIKSNWSMGARNRLVNILESNNVYISDNTWDLLLFSIKNLIVNDGKLFIEWNQSYPSKKVVKIMKENYNLVVENYLNIIGEFK